MARGLPAVWSAILGAPFVGGGAYVYLGYTDSPVQLGLPLIAFGSFVILVGLYIHFVAAPDPPSMREGEQQIDTRMPAQRAALAKTVMGLVLLGVAAYYMFFTFKPYIYPMAGFIPGLFLFSTGLHTYWVNTLTTYYVTNKRLIKEYRFISLVKQEVPFDKVRGVQERKSVWESIVGLGNVRVSSGGGTRLEIVVRNVYDSSGFADKIRDYI